MKIINLESQHNMYDIELKVRGNDELDYYIFPINMISILIECLKNSNILYDIVTVENAMFKEISKKHSKYMTSHDKDYVALYTKIDIEEIYSLIGYFDKFGCKNTIISLYKNSELPEFEEMLSAETQKELPKEIQVVLVEYMKMMIDLSNVERVKKIVEYMEYANWGRLLSRYSDSVKDFIIANVTKKMGEEILKGMR